MPSLVQFISLFTTCKNSFLIEWSSSCFSLQNFSSSSFVRPSALFVRPSLPDSLSCFRFVIFQRSYLEWCCNSCHVVVESGRNFVGAKLKFELISVKFSDFDEKLGKETVRFLGRNILHWPSLVDRVAPTSTNIEVSFRLLCCVAFSIFFNKWWNFTLV